MSGGGWTPDRVEAAVRMRREGLSAAQIARELKGGLTRNAVIGKLMRLGEPGPDRRTATAPGKAKPRLIPADRPATPWAIGTGPAIAASPRPCGEAGPIRVRDPDPTPSGRDSVNLVQRPPGTCAWPLGEPARPAEQLCCGRPVAAEGVSWCPEHRAKAFDKPKHSGSRYERQLRRYL
jgi:GcrA cell cycle regulator